MSRSSLSVLRALVASVFCLHLTGSSSPHDQHQHELEEHYQHLAYIAHFSCHAPQPRVIHVDELFSAEEIHGKAFFPDVTVLHRCGDGTGRCDSGHHCVPVLKQSTHSPFKVTFLEDTPLHKKGSWAMEYHALENHTECSCGVHPTTHFSTPKYNHKDMEVSKIPTTKLPTNNYQQTGASSPVTESILDQFEMTSSDTEINFERFPG